MFFIIRYHNILGFGTPGIYRIVLEICVLCCPERQRHTTMSCCLSATFLLNISYPYPSWQYTVSRLFFKGVLCLQALLLTQVQGCTKITSPSMLLLPHLPPVLLFVAYSSVINFFFNIICFFLLCQIYTVIVCFVPVSLCLASLSLAYTFLFFKPLCRSMLSPFFLSLPAPV